MEMEIELPHADPQGADPQATTVRALRSPMAYPGVVTRVHSIETHMAWVFLTDAHAYKLKKALRVALFDHTTIDARLRACEAELELNRRLAPDVYLDVVPAVRRGAEVRVDNGGIVVDWLVKMRRLPLHRMLDARIETNRVRREDIERLLQTLVDFYAMAPRAGLDGPSYVEQLRSNLEDKTRCLGRSKYRVPPAMLRRVWSQQRRWLDQHWELLNARAPHVVDAHGDLRPEHICLEHPKPTVIDCLEFSQALRLLDPASEVSFLALECARLGAPRVERALLRGFADRHAGEGLEQLFPFYASYHAVARAAVALWHLDDASVMTPERWRERALWYLHHAGELS